ncbi:STT3 domain-containing protein [Desulforhopalus singaporensis]|uniref:Oligosaccharyl transferase STT3 subunit n=1 Tax=Desulforhopalus singaporensis TaxID=91360 RepID=A0A1H0QQH4_9BACT|nr:STT3 domain-containing protein [Desulforhopalus singaporensis]SDP19430.1 Oligosaccharyl transferase STT3 subunit [Desulforhopalus singaporensis]
MKLKRAQLLISILLVSTILVAFTLRISSIAIPNNNNSIIRSASGPILLNPDGYYYLQTAKEIASSTYSTHDSKRIFPSGVARPAIPPLLSVLLATLVYLTPLSLEWCGVFLPVFFSFFLTIPVFLFCRLICSSLNSVVALFFCLTAPIFVIKTSLGLLDTDCLNLYFPLMISYCFYSFSKPNIFSTDVKWLSLGIFHIILFYWWWDMAPSVVWAFTLPPMFISIITKLRYCSIKIKYFTLLILFLMSIMCLFFFSDYIISLTKDLTGKFSYITQGTNKETQFPQTSLTNLEQQSYPLNITLKNLSKLYFLPYFSFIGLIIIAFKRPLIFTYLLPISVVGALSILAVRFTIFLVPVYSIGLASVLNCIEIQVPWKKTYIVSVIILLVVCSTLTLKSPNFHKPVFSGEVIKGLKIISHVTPENSVIYSWWDIGHPAIYYGERATLADGAYHAPLRTVLLAFPFAAKENKLAANYIIFMANRGIRGFQKFSNIASLGFDESIVFLQTIFTLGPEKSRRIILKNYSKILSSEYPLHWWLNFLFPQDGPPVYLFLENRYFKSNFQRSLYHYGTWKTSERSGTKTLPTFVFSKVPVSSTGALDFPEIKINYTQGSFSFSNLFTKDVLLHGIQILTSKKEEFSYVKGNNTRTMTPQLAGNITPSKVPHLNASQGEYYLSVFPKQKTLLLQDRNLVEMVIQDMFFSPQNTKGSYFELVSESTQNYQLWKVTGDKYKK